MSRPELVVLVADLERGPKQVEFGLSEAWLRRALEGTDASVVGPGKLDVTVSKNGVDILVRGTMEVDVTMPCVITLDPVPIPVRTEIMLMLSPQAGTTARADGTGSARRRAPRPPKAVESTDAKVAKPERPARSKGPSKADGHWDDTPILTDETAGLDTYDGHDVVLDDFAREFIVLELPMFPRRSDLPIEQTAANPPLPDSQAGGDKPLDPRLSPLAELKSRLEQKIKKE